MEKVLKWSDLQTIFGVQPSCDSQDAVLTFCFNCRLDGHTDAHCPQPRRCFICLKPSHQGYQCVDNPVPGSVEYKPELRCTTCNERGHSSLSCKSPGGVLHSKMGMGIGTKNETVYSKPMILHVPKDDGPSDAEVQQCRADILTVFRSMKHEVATHLSDHHMRDVEFFCAALPLLNDASVRWNAEDREVVRAALFKMRGAVAGSIALGDPSQRSKQDQPQRRAGDTASASEGNDVLYDMKASGLDINVIYGGKLDVFRRVKTQPNTHTGASRRGRMPKSPMFTENSNGVFVPPDKVVETCVYLSSSASAASAGRKKNGAGPSKPPTSPRAVTSLEGNIALSVVTPVGILAQQLDRLDLVKQGPAATPTKGYAEQTANSHIGGVLQQPLTETSSSVFAAPLAPHMQRRDTVASRILHDWETSSSLSEAQNATTTRPMTNSGAVRQFLGMLSRHPSGRQLSWTKSPSTSSTHTTTNDDNRGAATPNKSNGPNTASSANRPITNWNEYHSQHSATNAVELFSNPSDVAASSLNSSQQKSNSSSGSTVIDGPKVAFDLVRQWRERFDRCKAQDACVVTTSLAQRVVHRSIVASDVKRLDVLSDAILSANGSPRSIAHLTPRPPPQRSNGSQVSQKNTLGSVWSGTCNKLAEEEAGVRLRNEIVREVLAYAQRIHAEEEFRDKATCSRVLDEISTLIRKASRPSTGLLSLSGAFREDAELYYKKAVVHVRNPGALRRILNLAASLLDEVET